MPAVKLLHQQSSNNSKPEFIMGHSLQALSLLVHAPGGQAAAVPLTSRVHEGVVFSNRDSRSLLDKLVALLLSIARGWGRQVLLVADAYYASAKVIVPLLEAQHHLLTRAKSNVVAYMPVPKAASRARGRPRIYGQKVRLKELALDEREFASAPSPVYGDSGVLVRYRTLDLMWRSELIVASALRSSITTFFPVCALVPELRKIASTYCRQDVPPDIDQIDAMAA